MKFFTKDEFLNEYKDECLNYDITESNIKDACLMIFSQIGLRYRDCSWNKDTVPQPIKDAAMEQLRFLLVHDIPFLDTDDFKVDGMEAKLDSVISKKALYYLSNSQINYLYRGNQINSNMSLPISFGG